MIELHPSQIPDDLKKFFRPKRKYGTWTIRNCVIWHKPNPMPSSAKDRFTNDYEVVWFLVKSKKYAFEPQYEPCLTECNAERPRMGQGQNTKYNQKRGEVGRYQRGPKSSNFGFKQDISNPLGRNKRTVWTIPTEARSEAHFATFPQRLVEPMIKAGCSKYVCTKCGEVRAKVYDTKTIQTRPIPEKSRQDDLGKCATDPGRHVSTYHFKGYTDCGCGQKFRPGICLDMFAGSATVCKVAAQLGRDYIGIELNPTYINEIAKPFVAEAETGVSRKEQKQGQMALFENGDK